MVATSLQRTTRGIGSSACTVNIGDSSGSIQDTAGASTRNNQEKEPSEVEAVFSATANADASYSSCRTDQTGDDGEEAGDNLGDTDNAQQSDDTTSNESTSEEPSYDDAGDSQ